MFILKITPSFLSDEVYIPVILEAADALAALVHSNHIVFYAHRDELTCRLPATSIILGITRHLEAADALAASSSLSIKAGLLIFTCCFVLAA